MELELLPNEILCKILRKVTDMETIINIMRIMNTRLMILTTKSIKTINPGFAKPVPEGFVQSIKNMGIAYYKRVPFDLAIDLINVKYIYGRITIDTSEQLKILASLPHIKGISINYSIGNDKCSELIKEFIKQYCTGEYIIRDLEGNVNKCQNNRNFMNTKNIYLQFGKINGGPPPALKIYKGTPYIYGLDIDILTFYHQYSPIYEYYITFNLLAHMNMMKCINFLKTVDELHTLRVCTYSKYFKQTTRTISIIFNNLIDRITIIKSKLKLEQDLPKIFDITEFENSNKLRIFKIPISVDMINTTLHKFPNVEEVAIMGYNVINENYDETKPLTLEQINELLNIQQLTKIHIITKNLEMIPNTSRIRKHEMIK